MGATGSRGQFGDGQIIAVAELNDVRLNAQGDDEGVAVVREHDAAVPNATDEGAFVNVQAQVQLLELALSAVEYVRRNRGFNACLLYTSPSPRD